MKKAKKAAKKAKKATKKAKSIRPKAHADTHNKTRTTFDEVNKMVQRAQKRVAERTQKRAAKAQPLPNITQNATAAARAVFASVVHAAQKKGASHAAKELVQGGSGRYITGAAAAMYLKHIPSGKKKKKADAAAAMYLKHIPSGKKKKKALLQGKTSLTTTSKVSANLRGPTVNLRPQITRAKPATLKDLASVVQSAANDAQESAMRAEAKYDAAKERLFSKEAKVEGAGASSLLAL